MSGFNLSHDSASSSAEPAAEPLGLTVYDLDVPAQMDHSARVDRMSGRLKMLLVMLICAAPVIASYLTFYVIRPQRVHSYGELIDPQRPLPAFSATTLDGKQLALPELKGQWLLVSVSSGACDSACEKHLFMQRQIIAGLGKDRDRVDWVWLVDDEQAVPSKLLPALKDTTVLRVPANQLATWLAPDASHGLHDHLYLVDPLGHWMMRFPPQIDVEGALKVKHDLERLLRASASWDLAGRSKP